jgi:hypothetical protein
MAYIGRPLQVANLAVQSGTGDGSDTTPIATLDYATVTNGIAVYLDGVRQLAGTDFNVTAQTTLTFTTAPANGVGVDVYFLGLELSLPTPADASVIAAKIASNAVTTVKIIDDAVTLAKMAPGTDGNIISYDASGNPVAIATGTDGQVLTSAGAGAPPLFEALPAAGLTSYINTFTYDQSTTGSVAVTGVGFTPTLIIAHTVQNGTMEASIGFGNAGNEHALRFDHNDTADTLGYSDFIGQLIQSGTAYSQWAIASLDADGFTYAKTKNSTPTGTVRVLYLALK